MAEIKPFKAVLYDEEKTGDLTAVMAPPYDVISPEFLDKLYAAHPNNVVRLILGRKFEDDSPGSDRYSRSAADLKEWLSSGVLKVDEKPSIYYYKQRYRQLDGSTSVRKGFMALSRLEDLGKGKIHAHERTLSGPKADRLRLMEACASNFSSIFTLYSGVTLKINKLLDEYVVGRDPIIDVLDHEGVENIVHRVDDPSVIATVAQVMEEKTLFIADGHHRYETALNYKKLMHEKHPEASGDQPYDFVMMYFSNMDDEGMTVWPTHRVIHNLPGFKPEEFLDKLKKYFKINVLEYNDDTKDEVHSSLIASMEAHGAGANCFGMHLKGESVCYELTSLAGQNLEGVFDDTVPDVYKNLDVTVLHELILSGILGISRGAQERQENIVYVKNYQDAFASMDDPANEIVFLLNPTRVSDVKDVAEAGCKMPQKSTYFYPKLLTGLVLNVHSKDGI
ncbi:MAG: DUF1015 domain-containing protein [Thermodesulfobacteriota bacterium]